MNEFWARKLAGSPKEEQQQAQEQESGGEKKDDGGDAAATGGKDEGKGGGRWKGGGGWAAAVRPAKAASQRSTGARIRLALSKKLRRDAAKSTEKVRAYSS